MGRTSLPLRLECSCGTVGRLLVASEPALPPVWLCPRCDALWGIDPDTRARLSDAARELGRIRSRVALVPVLAVLVGLVVALAHPAWLLLVPLVVGAALTFYRPRYRAQVTALYQRVAVPEWVAVRVGAPR